MTTKLQIRRIRDYEVLDGGGYSTKIFEVGWELDDHGLPTEFLVMFSGTLLPLSSLEEKKNLMPSKLGTSQLSIGKIALVHGLVFSGVAHPRGWPSPRMHRALVSSKGREIHDQNRTGPLGPLPSSQRQAAKALALSTS